MKLHFKFNIVLIFFAYSIFIGCSTDISSLEYDVKQTHIPQSFENAKPFSETFSIKNIEDSKNTQSHSGTQDSKDWQNAKNTQDSKDSTQSTEHFSLKEFSTLIDDKHLHNLLHIALKNNTDVLIMASRIKQAQSQMKINTANMFPTINVGLNSSYIDNRTLSQSTIVRPGANSINANISMSWEVDLFGKLNALRQSSKKAYLQAQSNLSSVQISLIAQVATLYFTLRENAHSLQIAKATLENLEQIESINKQKYNLGLIDMNTYQGFVANTTTQRNNLENLSYTFEQNKNALLVLLNINAENLKQEINFLSEYQFPRIASFYVDKMPSDILLLRPDIQASIYALHAQLYKQTNAKAARLPTISLNGSIGDILYSTNANSIGSIVFQIANSITAPLLNRTSLKQNYLIQKELSNEAFLTLQNNINTALGEIENAFFDMQSRSKQTQNTYNMYKLGLEAYKGNSAKNARGLLDKNDFLGLENTYFNLKNQLHNAKTNEILSLITLFKALGGNLALQDKTKQNQNSTQGHKQ
ncbi:TolC family protein [Helicobacter typhlonius]|uniref:TolC family protein n=1 Tax=Helicobacter typhlonius TaxID=76936 RepID=UPI002FDFFA4B